MVKEPDGTQVVGIPEGGAGMTPQTGSTTTSSDVSEVSEVSDVSPESFGCPEPVSVGPPSQARRAMGKRTVRRRGATRTSSGTWQRHA
jgi:hypothetical protein